MLLSVDMSLRMFQSREETAYLAKLAEHAEYYQGEFSARAVDIVV